VPIKVARVAHSEKLQIVQEISVWTCTKINDCGTIKTNVLRTANIAKQYWSVRSFRFNYPERNKVSILIKLATLSASRPAVLNQGYVERFQEVRKLGWENSYIIFSNM